jgi:hypothetical protein
MPDSTPPPRADSSVQSARLLSASILLATGGVCLSLAKGDFGILAGPVLVIVSVVIAKSYLRN